MLGQGHEDRPDEATELSGNGGDGHMVNVASTQSGLIGNYPNPFNPSTNISYSLSTTGRVTLTILDVLGREVRTLVNEVQSPGNHNVVFDASRLASGFYFYRFTAPGITQVKKMVLTK